MPANMADQVNALCKQFADVLSKVAGIAEIPEDQQMQVNLKKNWRDFKLDLKVYLLSTKDYVVVDAKFDLMHKQGKMKQSTGPTPFGFPVFVVQKTVANRMCKSQVVIDI